MNHYQFNLMLGQDSFYNCVKVIMPFQSSVIYKVVNNEVEVIEITLPFKPMEYMNLNAIRSQAKEAAENDAIELGYIWQEMMVTMHELLKINP